MRNQENRHKCELENIKILKLQEVVMVKTFCVIDCKINISNAEKLPVFSLPKNEDCKQKWLKFINRTDCDSLEKIFLYAIITLNISF